MNRWLWQRIADQVGNGVGVQKTTVAGLNVKHFDDGDQKVLAIQQNPNTGSKWAELAKQGHKVVQFKDLTTNKYVGVSVDGKVREY